MPPQTKRAAPNGAARHLLSANSLKYGDEGARPGGVIKADIPQPRSGEDVGVITPQALRRREGTYFTTKMSQSVLRSRNVEIEPSSAYLIEDRPRAPQSTRSVSYTHLTLPTT